MLSNDYISSVKSHELCVGTLHLSLILEIYTLMGTGILYKLIKVCVTTVSIKCCILLCSKYDRARDWKEAVRWYDCVLNMTDYDEGGEFDGMQDEPRYLLLAREAEMYQEGGFNLAADPQRAGKNRIGTYKTISVWAVHQII